MLYSPIVIKRNYVFLIKNTLDVMSHEFKVNDLMNDKMVIWFGVTGVPSKKRDNRRLTGLMINIVNG